MKLDRRNFLGGAASFGALAGCRVFADSTGFFSCGRPNLKVGVLSDIHVSRLAGPGDTLLAPNDTELTFVRALEYFRDEGADAVLIAGDLTECGYIEELEAVGAAWFRVFPDNRAPDGRTVTKLFVCGNHELDGFEYGNRGKKKYPDEAELKRHLLRGNMEAAWERAFREKYTPILDRTLNGYRFVGINWEKPPKGGWALDPAVRLREFLNAHGKSLDPSRPFFVFQHPHPRHTCYGDWAWGRDRGDVTKLLSGYPNAVAFSGHSHYSLTDERTVWQGAFTSIGTASLRYTGMPYDEREPIGYENTSEPGGKTAAQWRALKVQSRYNGSDSRQGMLMSVYDDRIVLKRREFLSGESLGADWVVPLPAAAEGAFSFAVRAAETEPLRFAPETAVRVTTGKSGNRETVRLSFPNAETVGVARPYAYRIDAEGERGERTSFAVLAEGFNHPLGTKRTRAESSCVVAAERLPSGRVGFRVTPLSCWGRAGESVGTSFDRGFRRYRGAMSPFRPKEEDLRDLAAEGANLLRYQMTGNGEPRPAKIETEDEELAFFDAWSKAYVDRLVSEVLPWSRKYGLKVVIDLHGSPGRRDAKADSEVKMYHNARYAQRFVDFWRETARRCQPFVDVIYGYDLFNEPQQNQPPLADCDYWTLQERAARAIREVDTLTPVIVSGRFWDMPHAFAEFKLFADPNVIYQAHMYAPHEFTHQFVADWCTKGLCAYPGIHPKTGSRLDVELLKRVLKPVRDFQLKHGARIFIGEFSAIAWAPGADRYLGDCISLFEEYGWDWTYHAWREWAGWSVEHVCTDFGKKDLRKSPVATDRQKVLRDGFRGVAARTEPLSVGAVKPTDEPMPAVMPLGGN